MSRPPVEIKGLTKTLVTVKSISKVLDAYQLLNRIGSTVKYNILERTSKGLDFEGDEFSPYTEKYKKVREDKGLPTDVVDLFFTGSMLSSLTYEVTKSMSEVALFFLPTKDKKGMSNPEKAFYNDQRRPFFALSEDDENEIVRVIDEFIENEVF